MRTLPGHETGTTTEDMGDGQAVRAEPRARRWWRWRSGTAPLRAETPKDGLVLADFIDDMISLDPAEVFEFSAAEIQAQIYDRLVTYPVDDVSKLEGLVAESWSVSDDGLQVTFKIRPGHQVPLRQPADRAGRRLLAAARGQAQPVARLHPDPVRLHAREHGRDDQGHRRQHAGAHARQALRADLPALLPDRRRRLGGRHEARPGAREGRRHGPRVAQDQLGRLGPVQAARLEAQRERGAATPTPTTGAARPSSSASSPATSPSPRPSACCWRRATSTSPASCRPRIWRRWRQNPDIEVTKSPKGAIWYHGPEPEEPEPRQARGARGDEVAGRLRRARRTPSSRAARRSTRRSCPRASWAPSPTRPTSSTSPRPRSCWPRPGCPTASRSPWTPATTRRPRTSPRRSRRPWAQAGIEIEIIPADNKQTLTKYRARQHDIYIGQWGPDYQDPHTNAETFA